MKKILLLVLISLVTLPSFAQHRFIKVGAIPIYCPRTYYAVQMGYEHLLAAHKSLQIDARAALAQNIKPIYDYNGPIFLYALAVQYRYYLMKHEKSVLSSFYLAPILRISYTIGKYEGDISAQEDRKGVAIGLEFGKNLKIGKKMALNPFIGILGARSDSFYTRYGEKIFGGVWTSYTPPITSTNVTYGPGIRLGCNWVFGGGKTKTWDTNNSKQ